jgi:hypothetical protein
MSYIDLVFSIIFTIEFIIKIIGLGCFQYFTDNWNKFDFVVVVGAWITLIMEEASGGEMNIGIFAKIRILRLFRVSRLIR